MQSMTHAHVLRVERTRTAITGGTYVVAAIVMLFSLVTSYELLKDLGVDPSIAWLLGFAVDLALCIALVGDQTLQRLGVDSGWLRGLRWVTLAMSLFLNTGTSWDLTGASPVNWPGVVVHSLAPLLLVMLTESAQDVQLRLTGILDRLNEEQDRDREQREQEVRDRREAELAARRQADREQAERKAREAEAYAVAQQAEADRVRAEADAEARRLEAAAVADRVRAEAQAIADRATADRVRAEADRVTAEAKASRQTPVRTGGQQGGQTRVSAGGQTRGQHRATATVEDVARDALEYLQTEGQLPGPAKLQEMTGASESTCKRALRQLRETRPLRAAGSAH